MNAAEKIAEFAYRFPTAALGTEHYEVFGRAVMDTFATAIAGRNEEASLRAQRYARRSGLPPAGWSGHYWGSAERLPLEMAALCNGVAGHVLDYDDVTLTMRGHPSVAVLPALIGLGEAVDAGGEDVAAAYVVAFEVISKISKVMATAHYAKGWHSTSSIGVIGAAAGCARLLGLDQEGIVNAVGLAVSQAAGSRANFGTHAKSFQAGHSNAAGLRAALLAQEGFTATPGALDGDFGYLALYGTGEEPDAELQTLGHSRLELLTAGLEIKKYPLCYATHRALDGILDLRMEHGLKLEDVRSVHLRTSAGALAPLIHTQPRSGLEGKFSMQYAVSAALLDGGVFLSSFTDEAVLRPEVQSFLSRVTTDDRAEGPVLPRWCDITLVLHAGPVLHKRVDRLRGSAQDPLRLDELRLKVEDCVAWGGVCLDPDVVVEASLAFHRHSVRDWLSLVLTA